MMKKTLLLFLVIFVFGLVGCNFLPEEQQTTLTVDLDNYFNISTVEELKSMDMYQSYQLTNDIDLVGEEWVPIGTFDQPFRGNFNGNGYTISNLTITENHMGYNGLFGHVEGDIENLNITNVDIDINDDFLINVGGLVGVTFGGIHQVNVSGNIQVNANGGNVYAGLLAGQAMTDLQEVFVDDIFLPNQISFNQVSGFVSTTSTQINYLGGLIGKSHNVIIYDNRVQTFTLNADGGSLVFAGGLVGHQFLYDFETIDDSLVFNKVLFFNNLIDAQLTVVNALSLSIGGLIGYNQNTFIENNFVKAQYDLNVTTLTLGLLIGESWMSHINDNIAVIEAYDMTVDSSDIGTIVGSQQTDFGDIAGFFVNLDDLMFEENKIQGLLITSTDIQDDSFYQSNFPDLSDLFIDEVQTLFVE